MSYVGNLPDFLKAILCASLYASLLVPIILALQFITRRHIPARYRFALWLLVLVRLSVVPLPQSRLSIFNLLGPAMSAVQDSSRAHLTTPEIAASSTPPAAGATGGAVEFGQAGKTAVLSEDARRPAASALPLPAVASAKVRGASWATPWLWISLLMALYLIGVGVVALRQIIATLALHKIVRNAAPLNNPVAVALLNNACATLGIHLKLPVLVTGALASPAVAGLFRQRLLIPRALIASLEPRDLEYIFLHECAHLRRHDVLLNFWLAILGALHWFNPLVWMFLPRIRADRELACDELVLQHTADPTRYGNTLLKIFESTLPMRPFAMAVGVVEARSFFARRIQSIAAFRKSPLWLAAPSVIAFLLIAAITLTNGVRAVNAVPEHAGAPAVASAPPHTVAPVQTPVASTNAAASPNPTTGIPMATADTSQIKTISLAPANWNYNPAGINAKLTDAPISLPDNGAIGGLGHRFDSVFDTALGIVGVQYRAGSEFRDGKHVEQWGVGIIDLKSGGSGAVTLLPTDCLAKAISPDGSLAAVSGKMFDEKESEIQIVELKGDTGKVELAFTPYEGEEKGQRPIHWARFIDDDHLLTLNNNHRLVLWNIGAGLARGIWSLTLSSRFGSGDPVLTPDMKYLVIVDETGTYFVEAATGAIAGFISDPQAASWFTAAGLQNTVRPDGLMLARSTNARVKVFSLLGAPELIADIFMPPNTKIDTIVWTNQDYLLVNRRYLIDVNKGLIVWQCSGLGGELGDHSALFAADGRMWLVSGENSKVSITAFDLPGENIKQVVAALDMDQVMAIKPGMKVSMDIDIADKNIHDAVQAHFAAELKKNNMELADGQPVKLRVKIGPFNTQNVEYNGLTPSFTGTTTTVTNKTVDGDGVKIDQFRTQNFESHGQLYPRSGATVTNNQMTVGYEVDGKILWDIVLYSAAPMMLEVKDGQSVDSAIKEKQSGDWKQLDAIELPKYVPAFRDPPGFGQTAFDLDQRGTRNR